jgi:Tol biopolymer transport system component
MRVTDSKSSVLDFRWMPDGKHITYIATQPDDAREKALKDKGFEFVYYEENLKHRNLYIVEIGGGTRKVTDELTVWTLEVSPDGGTIAVGASEKNLIDQRYAFQHIYLVDSTSGEARKLSSNTGKLGNFAFNPDGRRIAYAAALDQKDHAVSQAWVVEIEDGATRNLTPENFPGHINWVAWRDNKTVLYRAARGVWNTLDVVTADGKKHRTILDSRDSGVIFGTPSFTDNFKHFAMVGATPEYPREVFHWTPGSQPQRRARRPRDRRPADVPGRLSRGPALPSRRDRARRSRVPLHQCVADGLLTTRAGARGTRLCSLSSELPWKYRLRTGFHKGSLRRRGRP